MDLESKKLESCKNSENLKSFPNQPESAEECVYYTRREIGDGEATAWVFKEKCTKCSRALMGKPRGEDGKVKIRAKEYLCPECGNSVEKKEYEESLTANIEYICPYCKFKGKIQIPFQRKKIKSVESLRFQCQKCGKDIDITRKMK